MGRYTRSVSGITQCSFAERIRFELGRTMDVVITTAISGDNTRGPLAGFDWRVAQFDPDVVFVMIGMNDCSEGNDISVEELREQPHAAHRKDGRSRGHTDPADDVPILGRSGTGQISVCR